MDYITIAEFTKYLKNVFDRSTKMQHVMLKGEISNFKSHTTGHLYFSLKDETSKINAIMFKANASKLNFTPSDGVRVLVTGRVTIYEATGQYQIYIDDMQEDGIGALYIDFEKLKKELLQLGYFDDEHKKKIPKYPKKVGVVTASTGAAIKDIITTIKRRYPICQIILFPSLVLGDNASNDIVKNINLAQKYDLDVLIVGRGGGSIEDLWPFNERIVAEAIYNSNIPIISAVGHEIDFTIADFVSDLRAPTPTAAAELAVPNLIDVKNYNNQLRIRLTEQIIKRIKLEKLNLERINSSFVIKNPMLMYENKKQALSIYTDKLNTLIKNKLDLYNNNLVNNIEKLKLLNPLNVLKRGYSVLYNNDSIVSSTKQVKKDDNINIKVSDGYIDASVTNIRSV